jgi:hypothetical protein
LNYEQINYAQMICQQIIWASSGTRETAPPTLRTAMNGDRPDAPASVRI